MAELDLSEAIEVATVAWLSDMGNWRSVEGRFEVMLTAAAPIIERQVREMVAAEVRGMYNAYLDSPDLSRSWIAGWRAATDNHAARIARGES